MTATNWTQIENIAFVAIATGFFAIAAIISRRFKTALIQGAPYRARELMTAPERQLFFRLKEALPPQCDVHAQVALNRIIDVSTKVEFWRHFNRISQYSIDYLVTARTEAGHVVIVAAIELDDSSHRLAKRQKSDATKNSALNAAGIKLIRWTVKGMPDIAEIRQTFLE